MKRYRNTRLSTDAVETIDFGGDMYGDDAELNLSDGSELDAEGADRVPGRNSVSPLFSIRTFFSI